MIWIAAAVLVLAGCYWVSSALVLGDFVGIIVGQLLGAWIVAYNSAKITPDMAAGMVYHLQMHYGAFNLNLDAPDFPGGGDCVPGSQAAVGGTQLKSK